MTGHGQRGKPGAGFPPLPTALGNRCRDSHIPAAPARGGHGEAEIQKQDSHFPTAIPSLSKLKKRKEINPRLIPCFQAHLWIRKRSESCPIQDDPEARLVS